MIGTDRMFRAARAAAVLLLLLAACPALPARADAPPPPATTAASPPPSAELQALVSKLQDDKARAELVRQLQALIAAQQPVAAPVPEEPQDFVAGLSRRLDTFAGEVLAGVAVALDAPHLYKWAAYQITDAQARRLWSQVLLACAVIFGLAVLAEWAMRRVLDRFGRRMAPPRREGRAARWVFAAIGVLIAMLPVAAFAAAAAVGMAIALPPSSLGRAAIVLLLRATIAARLILAAAEALLLPRQAWPSLVPAGEESRNYLLIWVRRFVCCAFFGFGIAGAAWWLGVPGAIYALMLNLVALGLALLAIVFILQNRVPVAHWIAGEPNEAEGWRRLRRRLAESWHVLAIVYVAAIYVAYALHDERGTAYVLRATALSLIVLGAAQLLVSGIRRAAAHGFGVAPELTAQFPLLERRANRYLPLAVGVATAAVYAVALLLVLQSWDLGAFAWFATGTGRRVSGSALSIALIIAGALVAWELLAAAIERNLAALDHDGTQSRTRRRTLLPLLRTAMACVIAAIAGLTVLSQIGLNIAPLLAGAGVVGVAVGFGSQALIKDIITGLFILIEDQIAVGDIVDLGKEHAGVVEAITIRTIRLRDQGGIVHTVPFSEVTTVKNLTRDFAYAVARVTIAYGEDIDRVVEILRGVCDELAADPELGPLILDKFDYQGVDSLNDFSVVLLLRVRTLPAKQWAVGRALNRLIKIAFDAHGIAMRDPAPVAIAGEPRLAAGVAEAAAAGGGR